MGRSRGASRDLHGRSTKDMKSHSKRLLSIGGFLILGMAAAVGLLWVYGKLHWEWEKRHFVCSHPDYLRLSKGMTMAQVEEILGRPTKAVRADDETQNF